MKPDRSNYEIWFIDWLEGNLDENQVRQLNSFLMENPDLQNELNELLPVKLVPSDVPFNRKTRLIKSHSDLTDYQFDYLCSAYLENDITVSQRAELTEIMDQSVNRRKIFELFLKLRLKPFPGSFKRKSSVKKLTAGQKVIRWNFAGLSAAAAVVLLLIINNLFFSKTELGVLQISQNVVSDTIILVKPVPVQSMEKESLSVNVPMSANRPVKSSDGFNQEVLVADLVKDSVPEIQRAEILSMVFTGKPEIIRNNTTASETGTIITWKPGYVPPLFDERSNVERFLARFFHEKIMNDPASGNKPVESFDIAKASINGLNKLFGWKMAINKSTDKDGEIKSYNFTSRLLKFNAPVKKPVNEL